MTQLIDPSKLDLEIIGRACWVQCEDDFLRERLSAEGEPDYVELAVALKRPVETVVGRVKHLRGQGREKRPRKTAPKWTEAMDAVLLNEHRQAVEESRRPRWHDLTERLSSTPNAIRARVRQLRFYGRMPR